MIDFFAKNKFLLENLLRTMRNFGAKYLISEVENFLSFK